MHLIEIFHLIKGKCPVAVSGGSTIIFNEYVG